MTNPDTNTAQEERRIRRQTVLGGSETPILFRYVAQHDPMPAQDNNEFTYHDEHDSQVSPYSSPYQLALLKLGVYKPKFRRDQLYRSIGLAVESALAATLSERFNKIKVEHPSFVMHPRVPRMGAQIDHMILENDQKIGVEIKMVNENEEWRWRNTIGELTPPMHVELQCQHQMSVLETPYHYVLVCFGQSDLNLIKIERNERIIDLIEHQVKEFWEHIEAGEIPEPSEHSDKEIVDSLNHLLNKEEYTIADFTENNQLLDIVNTYQNAMAVEKAGKAEKDQAMRLMKDYFQAHNLRAGLIPNGKMLKLIVTEPTEVPATTRSGSTQIRIVNQPKKKN